MCLFVYSPYSTKFVTSYRNNNFLGLISTANLRLCLETSASEIHRAFKGFHPCLNYFDQKSPKCMSFLIC